MAGGVARPVPLRPPGRRRRPLDLRPGRAAGGDHARAPKLLLLNTPHNPTGKVFTARRADRPRRARHRARPARPHRRGLRAPGVRRRPARLDRHAARACASGPSSSAAPARPSTSPAGRSAGSAARRRSSSAVRTAKQFLTYVNGGPFQPAVAAGLAPAGQLLRPAPRATWSTARDVLVQGLRDAGLPGDRPGGDVLRHGRRPRRAARRRRPGVLPRAARAGRRRRRPDRRVLRPRRTPTSAGTWCASRSASATRCWPRPCERLRRTDR